MTRSRRHQARVVALNSDQQKLVRYWNDALVESEQAAASAKSDVKCDIPHDDLSRGRCSPMVFRDLKRQFENRYPRRKQQGDISDDQHLIDVLLCPLSFIRSKELSFGNFQHDLFWIPARLDSSGQLQSPERSAPWIPRVYLEPAVDDQYPVIGEESVLESFRMPGSVSYRNWSEYWNFAEEIFTTVTGKQISAITLPGYTRRRNALITLNTSGGGATGAMQSVYRKVLEGYQAPGLIPALAYHSPRESRPFVERREWILKMAIRHSGQFGGLFSLAPSQRRAIHQALSLSDGEYLCVSGPPGTGKTTLLQSLIASLWINAISDETSVPPVIVGTAATNQAVTNIITAMARQSPEQSLLSRRWLLDVASYGSYCVSKTKAQDRELVSGFHTEQLRGESFSRQMEDHAYIREATECFLKHLREYSGKRMRLRAGVRFLAKQVRTERSALYRAVLNARDGTFWDWLRGTLFLKKKRAIEDFFSALSQFDCDVRARLFLLATHFWEGCWLLHASELQSDNSQHVERLGTVKQDWQRRAMVTPLFVSTASMLPRFFPADRHDPIEPIDFLIIDEASQMSPEEGVACLALTRRAIIVGDDQQLEPVWGVPAHVDRANAKTFELIKRDEERDWQRLTKMGLLASNGNLMRLALRCSPYNDGKSTIGVFLSEQRRCVPEIVAVCNSLSYRNRLIPARPELADRVIPALGYLHVAGRAEKIGTSRRNVREAKAIAQWIDENREILEKFYQRKIVDVLTVITPFAAQAAYLGQILSEYVSAKLRVGTVNSMQGAESEVVIFSPVYDGTFTEEYFFDRGPNMLNVAVSRAKDSFLVIGNLDLFKGRKGRPSGVVSRFLYNDPDNELTISVTASESKKGAAKLRWIATLAEHREVLRKTIECAEREVIIVSPTISSSAILADRVSELIAEARKRNVSVQVYTDSDLDLGEDGLRDRAREGRKMLLEAGAELFVVNGVHSKVLCADRHVFIDGSFNWLSANRSRGHKFQKLETSTCYEGADAEARLKLILDEVEYRGITDQSALL